MLGKVKGNRLCKYVSDYVVFDLETTGLSCESDEIIEISALKVRDGKIVDEYSQLVNPGCTIPYAASMINNITDQMVAAAPVIKEVLPEFLDFIGGDVLVGHNIDRFDMKFIHRDCEKYYGQVVTNDTVDTVKIAKLVFPEWEHRRLGDLAAYYGVSTKGAHRALADCKMNQKIYELLGKEMEIRNLDGKMECIKICPRCKHTLVKRNGKFGEFWGCSEFPNCRYTENI